MSDSAGDVLTLANEVFDADDKDKIGTNSVCFRTSVSAKSGHPALWRLRRSRSFLQWGCRIKAPECATCRSSPHPPILSQS